MCEIDIEDHTKERRPHPCTLALVLKLARVTGAPHLESLAAAYQSAYPSLLKAYQVLFR